MSTATDFFSRLEFIIPASIAGGAGAGAVLLPLIKELIKILKTKSETFKKVVDTLHNLICDKEDKREIKKRKPRTKNKTPNN